MFIGHNPNVIPGIAIWCKDDNSNGKFDAWFLGLKENTTNDSQESFRMKVKWL